MADVLLSLGSNINRNQHISACIAALRENFHDVTLSPVYESEAVGFEGDNFYNLVARINASLSVGELLIKLREIEDSYGRIRGGERFSARTLDIDILTYDDMVGIIDGVALPRDEILKNAFVLLPMADLVPEHIHPIRKQNYRDLWRDFDKKTQSLWMIELAV